MENRQKGFGDELSDLLINNIIMFRVILENFQYN
jgi:hypothetical protein